jgi:hypothetical protein
VVVNDVKDPLLLLLAEGKVFTALVPGPLNLLETTCYRLFQTPWCVIAVNDKFENVPGADGQINLILDLSNCAGATTYEFLQGCLWNAHLRLCINYIHISVSLLSFLLCAWLIDKNFSVFSVWDNSSLGG